MQSKHEFISTDGVITLNEWELRQVRDLIGDRADALLTKAAAQNDDNALDEAWEYIDLYNKLNASRTMSELRAHPAPNRRRKTVASLRAAKRF
jgi:hypothetical protein